MLRFIPASGIEKMNNKLVFALVCALLLSACGGSGGGSPATPPSDPPSSPPPPAATAPSITTQPASQTSSEGGTATFTVTAAGTAPLAYQWQKDSTAITGATAASYTTPMLTASDDGTTFSVVVSNSAGTITSAAATLTVSATPPPATVPAITTQPAAQTVVAGSTATFTVVATGTAPLSYQWQRGNANIPGATSATYVTPATATSDSGATFDVVVTNSAGSVTSSVVTLTVNVAGPTAPAITTQPAALSVTAGSPATFKVVATGSAVSYQWQRDGMPVTGAKAAMYTVPATVPGDDGAMFSVVVSNSLGTMSSTAAKLTVTPVTAANGIDVLTYKYDTSRTGQNVNEPTLTTANVNQATFGLLHTFATDGKVDAQPLYLSQLSIGGTPHNVLFITTEHGSVYAVDTSSFAVLWKVSVIPAGQSVSDPVEQCDQITPEIGITATPVIDRSAGAHGIIYVMGMSKDATNYHQILHALDVTTGADVLPPREIAASFTDVHGAVTTFAPARYEERAALLLSNGTIYTAWTSHCDEPPYGGWIISYNQSDLAQNGVLNVGPGSQTGSTGGDGTTVGPGIWMSGGGPAVDAGGNVFLATGNGPFDTTLDTNGQPQNGNYGQSFLKLQSNGSSLHIADYFALRDGLAKSGTDADLGSGGGLLLPEMKDSDGDPVNLYAAAGKDGNIYIVDQSKLGGFSPTQNNIYQEVDAIGGMVRATPAYFNNHIYFGPRDVGLKSYAFTLGRMSASPGSTTTTHFGYPGTSPSVSANGTTNGILWAHENAGGVATLHAYDAMNLANELYNSAQAGSRDSFGAANKFIAPVVTGGKVFVGTNAGVGIFGLLP
jgi:hypothetical protein